MPEKNDEISLKELILKTKAWLGYLFSKWLLILVVGIIGASLGLLYAITKKPTYTGTLTFVLSNDSKNGVGGLASLAGQFGLDVGGGNNGAFEGDNIIELLKSRRIVKGALFKVVPKKKDILVNIIGADFNFFDSWKRSERLTKQLPFPKDINELSPVQDSLISVIHDHLLKNNLNINKQDKKLSFYQVSTVSTNENVAIWFTKYLVEEAARLYIDTKTKTARENLNMLQHEADSLRGRLGGTIYATASTVDETFNLNPALQTKRVPIQQNQIQVQVLGTAYGEVIKNLEIAKITVQKETPLYQVIDEPIFPLTKIRLGKLKGILIGGIIGIFFCAIILLALRIWKNVIS